MINCRGKLIHLTEQKVMGILNVTPDSFYDGGKYTVDDQIKKKVEQMVNEGVDIIDIGGYSSRPGAQKISLELELKRLTKALLIVRSLYPDGIVSVDTFRSKVAKTVVKDFEVDIINDISAGNLDSNMFQTIAELRVPYIIMHMQGTPENMQKHPEYKDMIPEIFCFFSSKIESLKRMGVKDIIIDPGFGFGKTVDHNYELLYRLDEFKIFGTPILIGVSRKSMIYKYLEITPDESLNGTSVLHTLSILNGADILRAHDVKEAKQCIKLVNKYKSVSKYL